MQLIQLNQPNQPNQPITEVYAMNQITEVAIDVLRVHPRNQEFFDDIGGSDYTNFKESIKNEGIISEIVVAADMTILSGHQRYKAAKELGMTKVPVRIRSDIDSDNDKLKILLAANFGRSSNDPAKQRKVAAEYVALCGYNHGGDRKSSCQNGGLKLSDIATQLGTTERSLARSLRIERELSEPMKQLLDDGVISATFAADVIASMSEEEQMALIGSLDVTKKYTAKELSSKINSIRSENNDLHRKIDTLQSIINKKERDLNTAIANNNSNNDYLRKELQTLQQEHDDLLKQYNADQKTIEQLKKTQYSPRSQEVNAAYDFFKSAQQFVADVLAPLHYSDIVTRHQNELCGDYITRACNILIDAATDILRRFNDEVVDVKDTVNNQVIDIID